MRKYDISFGIGPAGTGKTYLAVAQALSLVLSKKMRKLVLTRPVVEAGESLGFLPGDLAQKINPYLRPLYDAMESLVPYDIIHRMEETRTIEIAPLAYMRGRSLNDCVVILDEAQNTTKEQMKMFLTRIGEGATAVITGDITQIDLPRRGDSGLLHAVSVLSQVEGLHFAYLHTADVVRNPLVKKIIQAYENQDSAPRPEALNTGPAGLILRPPFPEDEERLFALQSAYEREEVLPANADFIPSVSRLNLDHILSRERVLVAELDGQVVGKINTSARSFTRYQIGGVYVRPDCRGLGIGARMTAVFARDLLAQGRGLTLFVKKQNAAACRVYRKAGFNILADYRITYY